MKIVVPTKENIIDNHFGHCESYTIFTIDDAKKIIKREQLESPQGCGCKSNIAKTFQEIGIDVMLAGNIGVGAVNKIKSAGVLVIKGCKGDAEYAVDEYLKGHIIDSGELCSSSDHKCDH